MKLGSNLFMIGLLCVYAQFFYIKNSHVILYLEVIFLYNMHKKIFITIVVLVLIVLGLVFFFGKDIWSGYFVQKSSDYAAINVMEGNITKVDGSVITVEGTVDGKTKSVGFTITDTTILNNSANVISLDQMKSGKTFSPKTEIRKGELQDLKVGIHVSSITTRGDLAKISQTVAVGVNYITYDLPKIK